MQFCSDCSMVVLPGLFGKLGAVMGVAEILQALPSARQYSCSRSHGILPSAPFSPGILGEPGMPLQQSPQCGCEGVDVSLLLF